MNPSNDILDLCRLCATKTAVLHRLHIFDNEGRLRDFYLKLTSCLAVEVSEIDCLPKVLCLECVNKLESFYIFKINSLKTESYFKELLSRQLPPIYMTDECRSTNILKPVYNDISNQGPQDHHTGLLMKRSDILIDQCRDQSENVVCESSLYNKDDSLCYANTSGLDSMNKNLPMNSIQAVNEKTLDQKPSLFRCHYCKVLFPTRKASLDHLTLMHKKIHKCDVCGESFRSIEALAIHKQKYVEQLKEKEEVLENRKRKFKDKVAKKESLKCKLCGKEYARKCELQLHERSHTGEKPFNCTYCEKTFASTSGRNKHIQVHEKRWSHVCSYCGKGFVHKNNFIYHVQKHHTGERPFACSQCEKKFVRKQDLHVHELNMHSTKPRVCFKCEVCNKTFTTRSYLKQHKKIHELSLESRKTFKCNICDAVFTTNHGLKQHTFIHTGELPFECDICRKRFSSKIGLKIHLLIHSGVKKFTCEVCGKAFALRNSLVCHRRTHTGERPYQCDICHQQFTQKSSLNNHRKRHARDEVPLSWHN